MSDRHLKWLNLSLQRETRSWWRMNACPGLVADVQLFPDERWHVIINQHELGHTDGYATVNEAKMVAENEIWSRVEAALKAFGMRAVPEEP